MAISMQEFIATAPRSLILELREIVAPKGKESKSPLRDLSNKQLLMLYYHIKRGMQSNKAAELIQDDWNIHPRMLQANIIAYVRRFKRAALPELYDLPDNVSPTKLRRDRKLLTQKGQRMQEKLDALEVLHWNIEQQKERCEKWLNNEDEKPIRTATQDFRLLKDMCVDALEIEMKLGLRDRRPNEVVMQHNHSFNAVVANLQDGGALFSQAANAFLDEMDQYAMTMEISSDGSYELRERTEQERLHRLSLGICGGSGIKAERRIQPTIAGIEPNGSAGERSPEDGAA